mmetsp:Transcript_20541/g.29735  ORF Transcript_20541/g.29735 Transcript_20541/m.29735 type:complete len:97 (-) Transcript_20541:444-734(-)
MGCWLVKLLLLHLLLAEVLLPRRLPHGLIRIVTHSPTCCARAWILRLRKTICAVAAGIGGDGGFSFLQELLKSSFSRLQTITLITTGFSGCDRYRG